MSVELFDHPIDQLEYPLDLDDDDVQRASESIDLVWENVYIGPERRTSNKELMQGFTHVLRIFAEGQPSWNKYTRHVHIKYKEIRATDTRATNLSQFFDGAIAFINSVPRGGKILVHCYAGSSRSNTIVVAWLMVTHHMSLLDAAKLVRKQRPCTNLFKFTPQLIAYEKLISDKRRDRQVALP